jgi:hypothetical protein
MNSNFKEKLSGFAKITEENLKKYNVLTEEAMPQKDLIAAMNYFSRSRRKTHTSGACLRIL